MPCCEGHQQRKQNEHKNRGGGKCQNERKRIKKEAKKREREREKTLRKHCLKAQKVARIEYSV